MALETQTQPIVIENVREEEHFFGGDIVWWALLLLFSIPVLLWGLSLMPDTIGFLVMGIGGIMAGIGFAQIMFRLPYFTNSFVRSLLIVLLLAIVLTGIRVPVQPDVAGAPGSAGCDVYGADFRRVTEIVSVGVGARVGGDR